MLDKAQQVTFIFLTSMSQKDLILNLAVFGSLEANCQLLGFAEQTRRSYESCSW